MAEDFSEYYVAAYVQKGLPECVQGENKVWAIYAWSKEWKRHTPLLSGYNNLGMMFSDEEAARDMASALNASRERRVGKSTHD